MNHTVLFLCKHNACRSQMAEAFMKKRAGHRFEVVSAGLDPTEIHPLTFRVMNEVGIDLAGQYAKGVKELFRKSLAPEYTIIVCKSVEDDCPKLFPGSLHLLRWPFDDPASATGSEAEQLEVFRTVRDQIDARIEQWLEGDNPNGQTQLDE